MFAQTVDGHNIAQTLASSYPGIFIPGADLLGEDQVLDIMVSLLLGAREENPRFMASFVEEETPETIEDRVWYYLNDSPENHDLVVAFAGSEEVTDKAADLLLERHPELHPVTLLERFFHARSHVRFIEYGSKRAVLMRSELRVWHMALSVLPRLIPGFDASTLTEDEIALCNACLAKTPREFEEVARRLKDRPMIRRHMIGYALEKMNDRIHRNKIDQLQRKVSEYEAQISMLTAQISSLWAMKQETDERIWGLQNTTGGNGELTQLFDVLSSNPDIAVPDDYISDTGFMIAIRSPLLNFPDIKAAIDRDKTVIYEVSSPLSREDRRRLMTALFVDETYQLELYASFEFDLSSQKMHPMRYSTALPDGWRETAIPNPHLHYYACLGSYAPEINRAMRASEYQEAISIASASVASVNLHEFISFQSFLKDLLSNCLDSKALRRRDGTSLSPREAVEELKQAELAAGGE